MENEVKTQNPEVSAKCEIAHAYLDGDVNSVIITAQTECIKNLEIESFEMTHKSGEVEESFIKLKIFDHDGGKEPRSVDLTPKEAKYIAKLLDGWAFELAYKHTDYFKAKESQETE